MSNTNHSKIVVVVIALAAGLLLAAAGCGEEKDLCEQLFDKQLRLVGEQHDAPADVREQAVAQLRDAKDSVIELCRTSMAEDGAEARRALQCSLAARSIDAMRECEPTPTIVAGARRTGLPGPPSRTAEREPPPEAEPPAPPPEPPRTVVDPELGRIEVK